MGIDFSKMENKMPKMHLDGVHFIQLESIFFSLKMLFQSYIQTSVPIK